MSTTGFCSAHCTGSDWRSICEQVLQILPSTPAGDLAFVYVADALTEQTDRIVDYLRARTGIRHWVGSVAQGLCSSGLETYEEPAIAVLTTDLAAEQFRVMPPIRSEPEEWLHSISSWRESQMASVAVVHGDPTHAATPEVIEKLADQLQGFLVGGLTSSDHLQVQIADKAVGAGLSGVLFSAQVSVTTGLTQGCQLIGRPHTITKAERNVIARLDEQRALAVFKQDIGEPFASHLESVANSIFAALPVPGSDTRDYLVRNLVGIDPESGLLAIGDYAHEGAALQFAKRDTQTARDDLLEMIDSLKARLPGPAKGAIYHTCLGRGRYQFGDDSEELKLIQQALGDIPLVGFYANGEIFHRRLYGYTGVLSVFC